jgi:hypothetical protein
MHISSQRITENIYMYNPTSVFLLFMHENNSFSMFLIDSPKIFKLFGFPIFQWWAYLMKVIPEMCHSH